MAQVGLPDDLSHRYYYSPADPEAPGYDSVSAVLDATDSAPWKDAWGASVAAQYAVDHAVLVQLLMEEDGPEAAVDYIKAGARRKRQLKRDIGTFQHHVLEALLLILTGHDVPLPEVPPELWGAEIDGEPVDLDAISDGLLQFLTDWHITADNVLLSEATIANDEHGFAGTLDMGLWLPGVVFDGYPTTTRDGVTGTVLLIDCKTGRVKRRAFAQMAAYRRCPVVWLDWLGNTALTPRWDATAVLHLDRKYAGGGYNLVLMPADDEGAFQRFLRLQAELHDAERADKIRFRPVYPPQADGSQPPPRLEHLPAGFGAVLGPLIQAGYATLGEVAELTEAALLEVPGIGAKRVEVIAGLLAQYGLQLAEPETVTAGVA
jgi:hypothetical protein